MTIHSEHPFLEPESERDSVRRLRGRITGAVSVWTTGTGPARSGLTVTSLMVANGEPAHVLALVDPASDLAADVEDNRRAVVQLLAWKHRDLADAFAGVAPAPGGMFRMGTWNDTPWGPVLSDATSWAGGRVVEARPVGWSLLLDLAIDEVHIGEEEQPLLHRRGRYGGRA